MTTWTAIIRVGRWHLAIPLAAALFTIAYAQREDYVTLPLIDTFIPTPVLVALVTITVGLLPLYATFGALEPTLSRTESVRVLQVCGAACAVLLGCWPALQLEAVAALVCALFATGVLAVVVIGEYAWMVALTLGFAAVFMDSPPRSPVTTLLISVPLPLWMMAVVVAAAIYWRAGPREARP